MHYSKSGKELQIKQKIFLKINDKFVFAIIFSRACIGRNCIVRRGPNPSVIDSKIYQFDKSCYTFEPSVVSCEQKNKNIKVDNWKKLYFHGFFQFIHDRSRQLLFFFVICFILRFVKNNVVFLNSAHRKKMFFVLIQFFKAYGSGLWFPAIS